MMNKKKLDHINYGITKAQATHQILAMEMMNKLIQQSRQNNRLLREITTRTYRYEKIPPIQSNKALLSQTQKYQKKQIRQDKKEDPNQWKDILEHENNELKTIVHGLERGMSQIAQTNRKLYQELIENESRRVSQGLSPSKKIATTPSQSEPNNNIDQFSDTLLKIISKKQKKSYASYGIISEIMPFSDKRQIKVRFRVIDLLNSQDISNKLEIELVKLKTTQWVGMVFRATASICWNMLLGGSLSFEEVKVLFTQNIIFNFIELMNDLQILISEEKREQLTEHINRVSRDVLEFLSKQYPQTKVEAPNISLRKAIPLIQNHGQVKFDIVAMVSRDGIKTLTGCEPVQFKLRQDKEYSTIIMKTVNYIIDKTEEQYDKFQKFMTGIFQQIYLPKDKRRPRPNSGLVSHSNHQMASKEENQYREKVKSYSSYLIGRKIQKNTPKYTDIQIQSGVFFVKSPSVLRIITKWLEELWQFALQPADDLRNNPRQIKNHEGKILNISTRAKKVLFEKVSQRASTIKQKVEALRSQCYKMELLLTNIEYISDKKQTHLSGDQMSVGKYCSNLRNAISAFVCAQLSKIMHYLLLIPTQIDESAFRSNDEEFKQQAIKHLGRANLVTLKIFDLLRCKCHSNEEEIIHIVEALKQFDKDSEKFQIVRVKDRLNQGTRDILMNAQYDGGLVWEIQLAVTSHVDKKQDLLDKYQHFIYQLKRAKLGPLSQCVSIWATLEQRSTYFQQQHSTKQGINKSYIIEHKKAECSKDSLKYFMPFKRPIICNACKEYFSIPLTSLLNARCEQCKITYCGQCFYISLSDLQRKQYMFQNFNKKTLMNSVAFQDLMQYNNFEQPLPLEGFFIKKKFLNRELSYYRIVRMQPDNDNDQEENDEFPIIFSQIIVRNEEVDIRRVHRKEIKAKETNGKYYLKSGYGQLKDLWIYYFKDRNPEKISFSQLQEQMKDPTKSKIKYLNVLYQPNYMNELKLFRKQFQKVKLLESMKCIPDINKYQIAVYRFPHMLVMVRLEIEEKELRNLLIKKENRATIRSFLQKKVTTITMEQHNLTDQLRYLTGIKNEEVAFYLQKIQKLYLAGNHIADIECLEKITHLQILSISKNNLTSLKGVQKLTYLNYIKFDDNNVSNLLQVQQLVNLTYLSGNSNNITIPKGIENLPKLSTLALSRNQITNANSLSNLLTLTRIYLRQNPLTDIEGLKNINFGNLFIGGTQINPMDIAKFNYLSLKDINMTILPKMFGQMVSLLQLKLNKNKIKKIQNLESLVNLIVLDMSDNQIEKIENLSTLINLQILKLKRNHIQVVQGIKGFIQSLKSLQLQENPLNDLTNYLMYQERLQKMKLKYSEGTITEEAKKQLKKFAEQIGSRTESDD